MTMNAREGLETQVAPLGLDPLLEWDPCYPETLRQIGDIAVHPSLQALLFEDPGAASAWLNETTDRTAFETPGPLDRENEQIHIVLSQMVDDAWRADEAGETIGVPTHTLELILAGLKKIQPREGDPPAPALQPSATTQLPALETWHTNGDATSEIFGGTAGLDVIDEAASASDVRQGPQPDAGALDVASLRPRRLVDPGTLAFAGQRNGGYPTLQLPVAR